MDENQQPCVIQMAMFEAISPKLPRIIQNRILFLFIDI